MKFSELTVEQMEECAREAGLQLPIEQTAAWAAYQGTIDGRTPWGAYRIDEDGSLLGVVSFIEYETHGYRYLRSAHGPVWTRDLDEHEERDALEALRAAVASKDRRQVFARMAVAHPSDIAVPVLSTLPYDATVVIDLTGGDEEILARMKPRGRRDVRKAMRECKLSFADETDLAVASFDPYYEVMVETAQRDGFAPAPSGDYQDMLRILGPEHCRLFAGRDGERVITWTIATISGARATRYYGASRSDPARFLATDRLIYFECCELGRMGCTEYDQMGIGTAFQPSMMSLNTFKTKFAKDGERPVAPDRDVPIRKSMYRALTLAKRVRDGRRVSSGEEGARDGK